MYNILTDFVQNMDTISVFGTFSASPPPNPVHSSRPGIRMQWEGKLELPKKEQDLITIRSIISPDLPVFPLKKAEINPSLKKVGSFLLGAQTIDRVRIRSLYRLKANRQYSYRHCPDNGKCKDPPFQNDPIRIVLQPSVHDIV